MHWILNEPVVEKKGDLLQMADGEKSPLIHFFRVSIVVNETRIRSGKVFVCGIAGQVPPPRALSRRVQTF